MAFDLPQRRLNVRQIQTTKRHIPLEQIMAVEGFNPLAQGIETTGNVIGQALQKRAALRQQGEQLARLESLAGQQPGTFSGLDPSTAATFTQKMIADRATSYNPTQLQAIHSGDPQVISQAFPSGVPKEAATLAATVENRGVARDNLKIEREARREERINKDILAYSESLEKNPVIKDLKKQEVGITQVNDLSTLASTGNTVAFSVIGTKMARAMGEVGVLTESDIIRYVQSGRLDRKAADTLSRWTQGRSSQATLAEIQQINDVLSDSFASKIQPVYNTYVERLSRNYGLSPEDAAYRLDVPYTGKKPKEEKLKEIRGKSPAPLTPAKVGRFIVEEELN